MPSVSNPADWPIKGGELGELIRKFDWSTTSLGPIDTWPQHLRIKVNSIVNSPIPQVLMWGKDHVMLYNDGYKEIAGGYHPRSLGGTVPAVWPEIWDWNARVLEAGFRGEVQSFLDQPMTFNRSGVAEPVTLDLFYTPIYAPDGQIDGVLCTVLETTSKMKALRALADSQAELSNLTNALPILISFVDRHHIYRFANHGYVDWFGIEPKDMLGRHIRDVIGDEFYARRKPSLDRALAGEPVIADATVRKPDGAVRHAEIRYVPRRDEQGAIDGVYVLMIDIDERKRFEAGLSLSNARFQAAVNAVHGVLWTNSPDGRMLGEQPGWAALTGQDFAAYQGYGWSDAVHPDDRQPTMDAWNHAVARTENFVFEHRVRRHDGAYRTFAIRGLPILDDAGVITEWVVVHTDITEQRLAEMALQEHAYDLERQIRHRQRAEDQLRQLNETLEARVASEIAERRVAERALHQAQKMETIGKLTGGVAHDFNNLLQVVSGNLQLLLKDVGGNERAERRVGNALAGVARGSKLASQLLAFGRRQALEPKVINVGRFLKNMDDLLRRSIGEAVEIETIVAGGLWNTFADPVQVENAVLNLAINARDAMDGNGRLTIEVGNAYLDDDYARAHADVTPGQYVALSVTDTGSGMAPDIIEQVFEPFFSTKPEGKGTGLGLSMVYGFTKQSGGHVKIYSEVGHGTTVRIYLPRADAGEDREVLVQSGSVVGGSETVLVVEDDDDVRGTVVEMLTDLGYSVLKANNANAALSVVESGMKIDLLFTDVVMPGTLKSPELARMARERLPEIAVLFTSGYTENSIVHGGRLDAGVELLSKPYTREALARKIRHVLTNQQQRNQNRETHATVPPAARAVRAPKRLTVLLVEDDFLIRTNTAEMIEDLGHSVIQAGSRSEALQKLNDSDVDILVTDIGLPDGSGADLALCVRQSRPTLGIVFATGSDQIPADPAAKAVHLRKPYDADDLKKALEAVARHLER